MNLCENYRASAAARRDTYAFLARMYRVEIDQSLLAAMKGLSFEGRGDGAFARGAQRLCGYLEALPFNAKTELAVDFAKVFLGMGAENGKAAYPYESVYTSEEHLMMQDAHSAVARLFREKGVAPVSARAVQADYLAAALGDAVEPVDHIAHELDFMAYLVEEGQRFAEADDAVAVATSVGEQWSFLTEHLLAWVPAFCADVERFAETDFYRAVAQMTAAWVQEDDGLLADLVSAADVESA